MSLSAHEIFEQRITQKLQARPEKVSNIKAVYEFNLTDDPTTGIWTVDLSGAAPAVNQGSSGKPDCTVSIATKHLSDIVEGKLNPQMAFMTGKLKVKGNMGLALKLGAIL